MFTKLQTKSKIHPSEQVIEISETAFVHLSRRDKDNLVLVAISDGEGFCEDSLIETDFSALISKKEAKRLSVFFEDVANALETYNEICL